MIKYGGKGLLDEEKVLEVSQKLINLIRKTMQGSKAVV